MFGSQHSSDKHNTNLSVIPASRNPNRHTRLPRSTRGGPPASTEQLEPEGPCAAVADQSDTSIPSPRMRRFQESPFLSQKDCYQADGDMFSESGLQVPSSPIVEPDTARFSASLLAADAESSSGSSGNATSVSSSSGSASAWPRTALGTAEPAQLCQSRLSSTSKAWIAAKTAKLAWSRGR